MFTYEWALVIRPLENDRLSLVLGERVFFSGRVHERKVGSGFAVRKFGGLDGNGEREGD